MEQLGKHNQQKPTGKTNGETIMKLIKLASIAVAGAMAFAVSKASATQYLPMPKVNISGSVTFTGTNTDNGTVSKGTLKTISFSTKSIIALLNASPTFKAALTNQFGSVSSNQVPAGSYFVYDIYNEELIITNKNGFSFNLDNNLSGDDFGYLDIDEGVLFGSYSLNDTTGAGNEMDETSVYLYFYDYNGNEIENYGNGTLNWKFGPVVSGNQSMSLSVKMNPNTYFAEVNGNDALTKTVNISGSGSSASLPSLGEPFFMWW